jgi:hypothetical protein
MGPDERARSVTGEAHRGVLPAGSAHLVNEVVGAAAGGPQQYTGRLMGRGSPPRDPGGRVGVLH